MSHPEKEQSMPHMPRGSITFEAATVKVEETGGVFKTTLEAPILLATAKTISDHPNEPKDTGGGFLKSTLGASTIITAWLYSLGWTYLHSYFAYFGVNVASLNFSLNSFFTAILIQFTWNWQHAFKVGGLILICFGVVAIADHVRNVVVTALMGVFILALFWWGFALGKTLGVEVATRDVANSTTLLPTISLEFDKTHTFSSGDLQEMLGSQNLHLLFENKDRLLVFIPVNTALQHVSVDVISLDRSNILVSTTEVKSK